MFNIRSIVKNKTAVACAGYGASFLFGYFLSDQNIAGALSFADVSAVGALGLPGAAAVFTGSLIHSIIFQNVGKNIIKISSMMLLMIFKLFSNGEDVPKTNGILSALSIFISGAAVTAVIGEMLYKLLFYLFYSGITGILAYCVSHIITELKQNKVLDLSSSSGCAYAVVYTIGISALCGAEIPFINAGIIIGTAVTLVGAHRYGCSGGVLCGALTTCGAFLASQECGMNVVLLPVAGLMTGYLSGKKFTYAALFFLMTEFFLTMLTGVTFGTVYTLLDIIIGTALFTAAAPYISDRFFITDSGLCCALPEIMNKRMSFLSDSIKVVRSETEKISDILAGEAPELPDYSECSLKVCRGCKRRLVCWKSNCEDTVSGFRKLARMAEISEENFPHELDECLRKKALAEEFEKVMREKAIVKLSEMRFNESRHQLIEQIKIMEELIVTSSERPDVRYSQQVTTVIEDKLKKFGIVPDNVIAYYNKHGRLLAEIYFTSLSDDISVIRICDLIADALCLPMCVSDPVYGESEVRLRLYERPANSLEIYSAAMSADKSGNCGDSNIVFDDGTGISYVVLSDGMGSGSKAALESRLVVRMFRRLICSGARFASAVKLINSIMLAKSDDESFATLDALQIDLDECALKVMKSGASATLIRHNGAVMKVSSMSFPIGIYERSEMTVHDIEYDCGDIIVMLSDGISENEYNFIKQLLLESSDIKYIVDEICAKASVFDPNTRSDDVTVIAIRVLDAPRR